MGVVLSRKTAGKVANLIRREEASTTPTGGRKKGAVYFSATMFPARSGGSAIPAATVSGTETTYGSGNVVIESDDGTKLLASGDLVLAYNRLQETIPANTAVWLAWWNAKLWVVGYECGA